MTTARHPNESFVAYKLRQKSDTAARKAAKILPPSIHKPPPDAAEATKKAYLKALFLGQHTAPARNKERKLCRTLGFRQWKRLFRIGFLANTTKA